MPGFNVRMHIIEARELKGVDSGSCDPIGVVSIPSLGVKQETDVYNKVSTVMFDKLMFFEVNTSEEEFMKGNLKVEIFDYNMFTSNILIGETSFGLQKVYTSPGREMYKTWALLTNPDEGLEPQGFLKVSISAIKDGQSHAEHIGEEDDDDDGMIVLPPEMDVTPYALTICVYKGKDLPKVDRWGSCDGYIRVDFSGSTLATQVEPETQNPTWNAELKLAVGVPTMSDALVLSLFDQDFLAADDFIGDVVYSFREVMDKGIIGPHWANLYGWPLDADEAIIEECKSVGERPSDFKGSIMLSLETMPDETVKQTKKVCSSCQPPEECKYVLRCDVFQVSELPENCENCKVSVEAGLGINYKSCRSIKLDGVSSMEWLKERTGAIHMTMSLPKLKKGNPYQEGQIPDIFVKLMCGGYCVGYQRFTYNLTTKKELGQAQIKWYALKIDRFSGVVQGDAIPGYVQFRLQFGEKDALGSAHSWPATNYQDYMLRAHIFQGKDLPAADANGMSDPYLQIRFGTAHAQTSVMQATLFPRWYETVEFVMGLPTNTDMRPNINLLLFDEDDWSSDFLGRFTVASKMVQVKFNPDPQWYDVIVGDEDTGVKEGKILCSFQLMKKSDIEKIKSKGDYGPEAPRGITPDMSPCKIEVLIIGIRNMEPYNFMDVNNPIVEIDAGDEASITRTETGSSPNASWVQMLVVESDLPNESIYAPNINVRILDSRLFGEVNVGNGSIPIAPYMMWSGEKVKLPTAEVKAATGFDDLDAEDEASEPELEQPEDFLPTTIAELNEMVEEEFANYTFEKREGKSGGGSRTMGSVEKQEVEGKGDEESDDDDGPKKEKPREAMPVQWEVSTPDMPGGGGFDKDCKPPFQQYEIKRGQKKGGGGMFSLLASTPEKVVATLKIKCRAYKVGGPDENKPTEEARHKLLNRDMRMHVRLYVIAGYNLMAMDPSGFSDPFLNVELTTQPRREDKANTLQTQTLQPLFYVMYEFRDCNMPGAHTLTIEVWDEDFLGDDLIGKAIIDIEDRWYCPKWYDFQPLDKRPKEYVPLWSPMSGVPQGRLEIWIDTLTEAEYNEIPAVKMERPKGEPWELRMIIWRVDDIVFRDKSFINQFVSGTLEYKDISDNKMYAMPRAETDGHYFIDAGDPGVFHWRWIIPCKIPCKEPRLLVQTWDMDLISPNDSMAECNLALKGIFNKGAQDKRRQRVELPAVNMTHPNYNGIQAVIKMSLDVIPEEEARQQPVISGREGDAVLMKDFKRPPGIFANLASMLNPFAAMQRMMLYVCIGVCVVAVLGLLVMVVA